MDYHSTETKSGQYAATSKRITEATAALIYSQAQTAHARAVFLAWLPLDETDHLSDNKHVEAQIKNVIRFMQNALIPCYSDFPLPHATGYDMRLDNAHPHAWGSVILG